MAPTICATGETNEDTAIDTHPSTPVPATRNPVWDRLSLVATILSGISQQRDCHLTSSRSSVHHGGPAHNQDTRRQFNDVWTSAAEGS